MEDFENTFMGKLWYIVLSTDKRSFNEYFSEEHGVTCDDDISDKQIFLLCKKLMNLSEGTIREVDNLFYFKVEKSEVNHFKEAYAILETTMKG